MRKQLKRICAVSLSIVMLTNLIFVLPTKAEEETFITTNLKEDEVVELLSGDIYDVVKNYDYTEIVSNKYWKENKDEMEQINLAPDSVKISWNCKEKALYYNFKITDNKYMKNAQSIVTFDEEAEIEDLYAGTKYYYQISAIFNDRTVKSKIFSFSTADLTRTVYIDGVENTRDIGGYKTADGYRIRQGMVYRGGKLEDITAKGKQKMYALGIKTDLDLRKPTLQNSPIGNDIKLITVNEKGAPQYRHWYGADIWSSVNDDAVNAKKALVNEIKAFANADNYPIYVHCAIGRDRTGTICFLISALCGVEKNDLYKDYELSILSKATNDKTTPEMLVNYHFKQLLELIEEQQGNSLAEKTASYMKRIGITDAEIASIRNILIDKNVSKYSQNSNDVKSFASASVLTVSSESENLQTINDVKLSDKTRTVNKSENVQRIEELEFACTCSASTKAEEPNFVCYGAKNVSVLSEQEVKEQNIPEGYEEKVVIVDSDSADAKGVLCDFSDYNIPISIVESITFRVYAGSGTREVRIPMQGGVGEHWTMQYADITSNLNKWTEITLDSSGTNFGLHRSMENLSTNKYLSKLELALRTSKADVEFYIDSIKVKLKDNDNTPPVINISDDEIDVTLDGQLPEITAYDATEKVNVNVEKEWPMNVELDEKGIPNVVGTYELTLRATDFYGNISEKKVKVNVKPEDKEPPVLNVSTDKIYISTGTIEQLKVTATDDSGKEPKVVFNWQDGAFDKAGRLAKGNWKLDITATDASNKKTEKSIMVYVADNYKIQGTIVDEESGEEYVGEKDLEEPTTPSSNNKTDNTTTNKKQEQTTTKYNVTNKVSVPKTSIKKITAGKKKLTVKWAKKTKIQGYQIQISLKKNFKKKISKKVSKAKTTSLTIKKLKANKKYYVRIRTYKIVNKKIYYSSWSKIKNKKTK